MQLRGEITHNASSIWNLEGFKTLTGVQVAGIKNLSVTFVSYKLQNCDWPYSAVESAQPGPSFEKLWFRNLWCCQDLTSLNLRAMECLQHLVVEGCETLEKLQVCWRRVHAQTPLSQTWCNYVFESAPTIWRCTKWVCVEISRCLKLLLQCMDVEACEKLEFLAIKGSCEMSQGGVGHYRLKILVFPSTAGYMLWSFRFCFIHSRFIL